MTLKGLMERAGLSQREVARDLGLSAAAVNAIVNHGQWPKRNTAAIKDKMGALLRNEGATEAEIRAALGAGQRKTKATAVAEQKKEDAMLLRRQGLFPETKRHFRLHADPFGDGVRSHEDVFLSSDIRYVREALLQTAKHGGFMAVVGESGSGKSTLRRDLVDRITREGAPVHVIEPYVLGMEDNDKTGKTLKALHIAEAIMAVVAPLERIMSSPEARFRQLHRVLRDSKRAGHSHCLIIEEAHGLPLPTIKHLKRFWELEDGFSKLLSVILLGQPELRQKLSETNHEVREVVQRCEVVELRPMNGSLGDYVKFKFERAGVDVADIITADGIEALRTKLTGPASRGGARDSVSLVYPLAVGNMLIAGMNMAAEIGAPKVNADIIKQV
ncbi:MAG: AAA family ATPase [Desulfovibrionaceae bacterium]